MNSQIRKARKTALCMATGLFLAGMAAGPALAQSSTGAVQGRVEAGTAVTIASPDTGYTRTVTAGADGTYRLALLPPGNYTVQAEGGEPVSVAVGLGSTSTVNLGGSGGDGATTLGTVQVVGSRVVSPVDVTSTESATNLNDEQIALVPVDRNVSSVALLAPGVNKGGASFGGVSFGGSSVAENAYYINGLNVTDFYNRNAFSEAPFSFYKEFQIKTGGYSVEFGRTTGGVVNALAKSGTNEFHYGATLTAEPRSWQSKTEDRYFNGERYLTSGKDNYSSTLLDLYASGPIVKDKLFFYAMYEGRDYQPQNTDDTGTTLTKNDSDDGFWGATLDWYITDRNILSLMAFENKSETVGDVYDYDYDAGERGQKTNEVYSKSGGLNYALTWTSYFTDDFSMKLMAGENNRTSETSSLNDIECNYVAKDSATASPGVPLGCTTNASVYSRDDKREQARADFEWTLGDHLLRFGYDHEKNTSELDQHYSGPDALYYNVYAAGPGTSTPNPGGGVVPPGYNGYVRARRYELFGTYESTNSAWYVEDNWQVTDNLLLNVGLRSETFDNKDASGRTYIKMENKLAPRLGFAWDFNGEGRSKIFGNLGRYYLPVANVINIKQGGALLDERTYYAFGGWDIRERNGSQYAVPILGPQIGPVDVSQGDGTVGDLRSEVDKDMDQVYQDEAILGFQGMITDKWSWGVRGIYRKLHQAIDDMEISATSQCGPDGYVGWVMANPGEKVTVWGDTDCDGESDGYLTVDTSKEGWAMYDTVYTVIGQNEDGTAIYDDGVSVYKGQRGWDKPKRNYKAIELQFDRAWDEKWAFNAAYTLSWSKGNAEGPVNSDTNFSDTGRTENFDNPWVNYRGYGFLANDHRHQLKLRGTYAFNDHWRVGATLDARSGGPVTAFGVGNPFDETVYHSYYICETNCTRPEIAPDGSTWSYGDAVYSHSRRGAWGKMPFSYELGASVSYLQPVGPGNLQVKFSVFNLLNQQRKVRVDQELEPSLGERNDYFNVGYGFQSPRYAQLTVALDF